jgi:putative tryptophan/tyrosine transport system substrate-binding protein
MNRREFITLNFVRTGEAAMMCWALGFVGGVAYRPTIKVQPIKLLRAAFLTILSLLAAPCAGVGQQPKKIPWLCFLTFDPGTLRTRSPRFDGFFQGLQDLGYVHGRNINISYLSADNNGDRFPTLIEECLSLKPDVIAVTTTPAAHLLKKATSTIPIVMVALGDPLGTGLVDRLSRPSENITGMSLMVPELAVKRLELLKELVPGISRVLVLSFLADPIAPIQVKAMEGAAPSLGVTLQVQDIRTGDDIPIAFDAANRARAEGVLVTEESMFIVHRTRVTELAARHKLPTVYPFLLPVTDAGGLMAYTVKASELHRNAAVYVDRILKGAKVADLPVQQPTQFEFVINLKTANALDLTVPPQLLARADKVLE